jgi:hypothetical protein
MRTALVITLFLAGSTCRAQTTHWSFKPPVRPAAPKIENRNSKLENPIDSFILDSLRKKGLTPSPSADRRTLIRRLTFDLTGLPPTPQEIAAFVTDRSPKAYEKLVDRLLASPHFGERWGQHWLDVVRFAESNGYEHDLDRPQAWRYRDWVVKALNDDMPFDRFVQTQVAGDLLKPDDFDSRVATGFLRAGPFHITGGNLDPDEMRQEWLTEAVAGVGNGILGLTIGCARCHDHKLDPVPQVEYYRLQAFFAPTANQAQKRATEQERKAYEDAVKAADEKRKPINAEIAAIEKPYREKLRQQKIDRLPPDAKAAYQTSADKRTPEQKKLVSDYAALLNISWDEVVEALNSADRTKRAGLRQQLFAIDRAMPPPIPEAQGVGDALPAKPMRLLVRGEVHKPGDEVDPGFPSCVTRKTGPIAQAKDRRDLAAWLISPENPLTARVIVNRLWHYLFGKGIVATPNDFGAKGQPPTHPQLLDWLACELRQPSAERPNDPTTQRPWSLKRLIRLMVTSDAYRRSSDFIAKNAEIDPDNRLLWRIDRKRLDAEALRDSVLAISGALNPEIGGPSVRIPLEPEVYDTIFTEYEPDNLWETTPDPKQHTRRSLYLFRKRNVRLPMLSVFDQPDLMTSCAARGKTVHALQALTLVNSEFMRAQSVALAKRILAESVKSDNARIDRLFTLTLARPASSAEMNATKKFLAGQTALLRARKTRAHEEQAWSDLCLATLNLNEFLYVK